MEFNVWRFGFVRMMRRSGLFLFCAGCLVSGFGQGLEREWVRTYALEKGRTNQAQFIALTPDGGVVVAGSSANGSGDLDYLVIKYAANGEEVWKQRYDSGAGVNDQVRGVAMDPAGNIFVTGTSKTVKVSGGGQVVWAAPFGGRAVAANVNYVYVTGFSEIDWATVQLENDNLEGRDNWVRTFNGAANFIDLSQVIGINTTGDVFVAGAETVSRPPGVDYVRQAVIKYSESGTQLWHGQAPLYPGSFSSVEVSFLIIDSNNNCYLNAEFNLASSIFKFASDGAFLWKTDLGMISTATILDINQDIIAAGSGAVKKVKPDGSFAWVQRYGDIPNGGRTGFRALTFGRGGEIVAAGRTWRAATEPTDNDILVFRVGPDGSKLGAYLYDTPHHGDDLGNSVVVDNSGNIYVTGFTTTLEGGSEFVTIKYSSDPTIEHKANGIMELKFHAAPGQKYALEATRDFFNWESLITNTADVNGVVLFEDTDAAAIPYRFYRGKTVE